MSKKRNPSPKIPAPSNPNKPGKFNNPKMPNRINPPPPPPPPPPAKSD